MKPTVLVLGSFDVLHYGHLRFLNQAAQLGRLVVGLGTDTYQEAYKRRPILNYEERRAALEALGYVVEPRDEVSIVNLCSHVQPSYLVAGSDWIGQPFLELSGIDAAWLEANNIALVYVPRNHNMSTSEILGRVEESFGR